MSAEPVIPTWLKLGSTLFVCILIPVYWRHYGPTNFLWFSDIALFMAVLSLWTQSPLLASMAAVSVLLLDTVWSVDFLLALPLRRSPTGFTAYMFEEKIPLLVRALSLFHLGLPPLLLWLIRQFGYDRRALVAQTLLCWIVLPVTYALTEPARNINGVFAPIGIAHPWPSPRLYLAVLALAYPLLVYLPTHLVLLAWPTIRTR